jgi:hypothetical protein
MNPEPNFLYQLLLSIGFLGAVAVAWMALHNQGRSQKREITFSEQFATREEVGDLRDQVAITDEDHKESRHLMYMKLDELRKEMRADIAGIAQKADRIIGVESETRILNQRLIQMDDKLTSLLRRP